jgi:hypothetical protein
MENFTDGTDTMVNDIDTSVESVAESSETTIPVFEMGLKKLKKLKVSECGLYPIQKIIKGQNIRNEAKLVKSLPALLESIASNGISTPLLINQNAILIDGFRRYACATQLNIEEIPVSVIDIKDEEIPFYQFLTMEREGIDDSERGLAVFNYTLLNPSLVQGVIAKKFNVSIELVSRATRIAAKGEVMVDGVQSGLITPSTAYNIIERASDEKFIHVENLLQDKLNEINTSTEEDAEESKVIKPVKPITLKTLNNELTKLGVEPITREDKAKEKAPKVFDKDKVLSFLECLEANTTENVVNVTATVDIETWNYIKDLLAASKKFNLTTISVRDVEDELSLYSEYSVNGECFIQVEQSKYVSFNSLLAEYGYPLTVENQLERVTVSAGQLNGLISKIQNDVTIINVTKYQTTSNRGRKKAKATTPVESVELTPENSAEYETDIQAGILKSLEEAYKETVEPESTEPVIPVETTETDTASDDIVANVETTSTLADDDDNDTQEEFNNLIFDYVEGEILEDDDDIQDIGF